MGTGETVPSSDHRVSTEGTTATAPNSLAAPRALWMFQFPVLPMTTAVPQGTTGPPCDHLCSVGLHDKGPGMHCAVSPGK